MEPQSGARGGSPRSQRLIYSSRRVAIRTPQVAHERCAEEINKGVERPSR